MFFTSNHGDSRIPCTNSSCIGHNGTSATSCPTDLQCNFTEKLVTHLSYTPANSPEGPWSTPVPVPSLVSWDTNAACSIANDSSLLCVGRPAIGMLTATDWRNISTYTEWDNTATSTMLGEDPMVWLDTRGTYHVVTHGGDWNSPFGFHYWITPTELASGKRFKYNNHIRFYREIAQVKNQSKAQHLSRRERPHVVLGKDGTPIALSTAVTVGWPCDWPDSCPEDYCYTHVQPVHGWLEHM